METEVSWPFYDRPPSDISVQSSVTYSETLSVYVVQLGTAKLAPVLKQAKCKIMSEVYYRYRHVDSCRPQ
jgi:hypothetical protein